MAKEDLSRVHFSSVYPYYQRLMAQANTQFAEPAAEIANIAEKQGIRNPTTPQLELARNQARQNQIDILKSKDHLQGVLFKK